MGYLGRWDLAPEPEPLVSHTIQHEVAYGVMACFLGTGDALLQKTHL
jgi:hypothetical protein